MTKQTNRKPGATVAASAIAPDAYTRITNRIVADLEQGVRPWCKPWGGDQLGGRMPEAAKRSCRLRRPPHPGAEPEPPEQWTRAGQAGGTEHQPASPHPLVSGRAVLGELPNLQPALRSGTVLSGKDERRFLFHSQQHAWADGQRTGFPGERPWGRLAFCSRASTHRALSRIGAAPTRGHSREARPGALPIACRRAGALVFYSADRRCL